MATVAEIPLETFNSVAIVNVTPTAPEPLCYEMRFRSLFHEGRAYAFPCDAAGRVDIDELPARARDNYLFARTLVGRDFATRGQRFDETLDVMLSLFNDEITAFEGKTLSVPAVGMIPKPQTRPHPPFIFGGHAIPALRRAAQRGDGWLASELSPEEVTVAMRAIGQFRADAGKGGQPFEISCHINGDPDAELVSRYADAGVDRLVVRPWVKGRDAVGNLSRLADRLGLSG